MAARHLEHSGVRVSDPIPAGPALRREYTDPNGYTCSMIAFADGDKNATQMGQNGFVGGAWACHTSPAQRGQLHAPLTHVHVHLPTVLVLCCHSVARLGAGTATCKCGCLTWMQHTSST